MYCGFEAGCQYPSEEKSLANTGALGSGIPKLDVPLNRVLGVGVEEGEVVGESFLLCRQRSGIPHPSTWTISQTHFGNHNQTRENEQKECRTENHNESEGKEGDGGNLKGLRWIFIHPVAAGYCIDSGVARWSISSRLCSMLYYNLQDNFILQYHVLYCSKILMAQNVISIAAQPRFYKLAPNFRREMEHLNFIIHPIRASHSK